MKTVKSQINSPIYASIKEIKCKGTNFIGYEYY